MDSIGNAQFHVMCEMWGVDRAINAAENMGMKPSKVQIEVEREKEKDIIKKWDRIFKPKEENNV